MITLQSAVYIVLFLLGAGAIFGLLFYLIRYCEKEFPEAPAMFFKFARIALVILAILVLIGIILDLMGHPIIAWR